MTMTEVFVHKARLTWQWQHLAHLLLFGPDQVTVEKIRKYSRLIPSSLSLTTVSICLLVKVILSGATKLTVKISQLKWKCKVTKIKLQPQSFSLLQIRCPCVVPSNTSLPPAPFSLFCQLYLILSPWSSCLEKAFKFHQTQYPRKYFDSKKADLYRTINVNKNSAWGFLNSGKNTACSPPGLIPSQTDPPWNDYYVRAHFRVCRIFVYGIWC